MMAKDHKHEFKKTGEFKDEDSGHEVTVTEYECVKEADKTKKNK